MKGPRTISRVRITDRFAAAQKGDEALECGGLESLSRYGGPRVRISLPPAESQVRTCLSREFAFLGREAAVFRGCAGRDERRGRRRHEGRGNIGPTGGNISAGPYSSTAPPVMRSATMPRGSQRSRAFFGLNVKSTAYRIFQRFINTAAGPKSRPTRCAGSG
jgi:hypothetical protein